MPRQLHDPDNFCARPKNFAGDFGHWRRQHVRPVQDSASL